MDEKKPIKVRIKESYVNQFVTTVKGYIFYKDESTDYYGDDREVDNLLAQGILFIEKSEDSIDLNSEVVSEALEEEKELQKELPKEPIEEETLKEETRDDYGNNTKGLQDKED